MAGTMFSVHCQPWRELFAGGWEMVPVQLKRDDESRDRIIPLCTMSRSTGTLMALTHKEHPEHRFHTVRGLLLPS